MGKRILAVLLCLSLTIGLYVPAYAAEIETVEAERGETGQSDLEVPEETASEAAIALETQPPAEEENSTGKQEMELESNQDDLSNIPEDHESTPVDNPNTMSLQGNEDEENVTRIA